MTPSDAARELREAIYDLEHSRIISDRSAPARTLNIDRRLEALGIAVEVLSATQEAENQR